MPKDLGAARTWCGRVRDNGREQRVDPKVRVVEARGDRGVGVHNGALLDRAVEAGVVDVRHRVAVPVRNGEKKIRAAMLEGKDGVGGAYVAP